MTWVRPDAVARSVHDVDYGSLLARGVQAVLFDLENTLCPWRAWELDDRTWRLLDALLEQGFRLAVVTNARLPAGHPLVVALGRRGVPVVDAAQKPFRKGIRRALDLLGIAPGRAAVVGDQLLTDVLGARRAGLLAVLVDPLGREESLPTKFNRGIERLLGRPQP